MSISNEFEQARRAFLLKTGVGLGWLSLAELLGTPAWAQQSPIPVDAHAGLPGFPHFPPKAKRVIYLHMLGAFSQNDTFDYKPMLEKMHGEELPSSVLGNRRLSTMVKGQTSYPDRRPGREVQAIRQERNDGQRCDAARRAHRR